MSRSKKNKIGNDISESRCISDSILGKRLSFNSEVPLKRQHTLQVEPSAYDLG